MSDSHCGSARLAACWFSEISAVKGPRRTGDWGTRFPVVPRPTPLATARESEDRESLSTPIIDRPEALHSSTFTESCRLYRIISVSSGSDHESSWAHLRHIL